MIFIIIGIIVIIIGILLEKKSRKISDFNKKIKTGQISGYMKTTGKVICNGYSIDNNTEVNQEVTPIVEYEVNGVKYEACNQVLSTGAELPVGTIVNVWYKVNDPKIAILGTSESSNAIFDILGVFIIIIGVYFILLGL